jgi:hypothetical protein
VAVHYVEGAHLSAAGVAPIPTVELIYLKRREIHKLSCIGYAVCVPIGEHRESRELAAPQEAVPVQVGERQGLLPAAAILARFAVDPGGVHQLVVGDLIVRIGIEDEKACLLSVAAEIENYGARKRGARKDPDRREPVEVLRAEADLHIVFRGELLVVLVDGRVRAAREIVVEVEEAHLARHRMSIRGIAVLDRRLPDGEPGGRRAELSSISVCAREGADPVEPPEVALPEVRARPVAHHVVHCRCRGVEVGIDPKIHNITSKGRIEPYQNYYH